ncbi:unnamed protein product [Ilex paraguariensis]|uniref:Uncharacterized protein n=1 Tax=Ilex paraguariensis TaxID=185542 RepID=A0ABC8RPE2_9AQUA
MTACYYAFQVNDSIQRSSTSHRFDHFKTLVSSPFKVPLGALVPFIAPACMHAATGNGLGRSGIILDPKSEMEEAVLVTNTVEGRIPYDFPDGVYITNGPNPLFGGLKSTVSIFGRSSHTWIEGEGMLHALYFNKDSDGSWTIYYNSRQVQIDTFKLEQERNKPTFLPAIERDSAILSAYPLNLLRLGKVNKYLSNTNVFEHSGKFYSISKNHIPQEINIFTLETLADGMKLIHRVDLKPNQCSLCLDMGVTQRLIRYDKKGYVKIGVMPRYGDADSIQWFEVDPSSVFHIVNCFENGDKSSRISIPGPNLGLNKYEWFSRGFKHVNLVEDTSDGRGKYGGLAKLYFEEPEHGVYLELTIKTEYHSSPENTFCLGATFVPKVGGLEEDDGFTDLFTHYLQVYVVDTKNFSSEPVAKITLPSRVPYGFHGAFMSTRS